MITGYDVWRWVGYCFVDTYFDDGGPARESVQDYHDDAQGEEGFLMDPFTWGTQDANIGFRDPREYFLVVVQSRLSQITREWEQVVYFVGASVRRFNQVCVSLFTLF